MGRGIWERAIGGPDQKTDLERSVMRKLFLLFTCVFYVALNLRNVAGVPIFPFSAFVQGAKNIKSHISVHQTEPVLGMHFILARAGTDSVLFA